MIASSKMIVLTGTSAVPLAVTKNVSSVPKLRSIARIMFRLSAKPGLLTYKNSVTPVVKRLIAISSGPITMAIRPTSSPGIISLIPAVDST